MSWEKTVRQIVREAHQQGCMDVLHAVLDEFERDAHICIARDWAERLYRDPAAFSDFVHDAQRKREGT